MRLPLGKSFFDAIQRSLPSTALRAWVLSVRAVLPWRHLPVTLLLGTLLGPSALPLMAAATVTLSPATATLTVNASKAFSATLSGVSPTTVTWSAPIGGTVTSAGVFTAAAPGTYKVRATSTAQTSAFGEATVTVVAAPSITSFSAGAATLTSGTSTTLKGVFSNGTGSVDNGVGTITSGTAKTLSPAATTTYKLTVINAAGSAATATQTITVVAAPVATITAPTNATAGGSGLSASVPAQSGSTYAWTITGGTITAGATANAVTFSAGAVGTLSLSCKVTNAAGTAATGTKNVTVVAAPTITSFSAGASTITSGTSTTLKGVFSNGTGSVDNGVGTITSGTAKTLSPAATTAYKLTVTNAAGSAATATQTVTVVAAPNATITAPANVTTGAAGLSASVSAQGGSTYAWTLTGGTITSGASASALTFSAGTVGTLSLSCKVTNAAGTAATGTKNVAVVAAPNATLSAPTSALAGATGLSASVPAQAGSTYAWTIAGGTITAGATANAVTFSAGAVGTLSLSCKVTNAAGTSATGTANLPVTSAVSLVLTPGSAALKVGQSATFTATVSGSTDNAVTWSITEGAAGGAITSAGAYTAPATPGTYHVVATSHADPAISATAIVTVSLPDVSGLFGSTNTPRELGGIYHSLAVYQDGATLIGEWDWSSYYPGFSLPMGTLQGTLTGLEWKGTWTVQDGSSGTFDVVFTADLASFSGNSWSTPDFSGTALPFSGGRVANQVVVKVIPTHVTLKAGASQAFRALVGGTSNKGVRWDALFGTIDASGAYTAPATAQHEQVGATPNADAAGRVIGDFSVTLDGAVNVSGGFATDLRDFTSLNLFQQGGVVTAFVPGLSTERLQGNLTGLEWKGTWTHGDGTVGSFDGVFGADGSSFAGSRWATPDFSGAAVHWSAKRNDGRVLSVVPTDAVVKVGVSLPLSAYLGGLVLPDAGLVWTTTGGSLDANQVFSASTPGVYTVRVSSRFDASVTQSIPIMVTQDGLFDASGTYVDPSSFPATPYLFFQKGTQVTGSYDLRPSGGTLHTLQGTLMGRRLVASFDTGGTLDVTFAPDGSTFLATTGNSGSGYGEKQRLVSLQVGPAVSSLHTQDTLEIPVLVAGSLDKSIAWQVSGGRIWPKDLFSYWYTAPEVPGSATVKAVSGADATKSATLSFTVVGGAPDPSMKVVPASISLAKGGTCSFSALVGTSDHPSVTWTASGGTIDANGFYTAPNAYGTFTVMATSTVDPTLKESAIVLVGSATGTDRAFSYDLNGNLTDDGDRSFEWDAEDRLAAITIKSTGHRSEFVYDFMGRRVEIIEKDNNTLTSDQKYLWDGVEIAEARSADGATVLKRFYAQGFVDSDGTALFYTRDHLGSIRELTDSSQVVRARYEYDPYGWATKVSGDRDSVFQYTGHMWHAPSGLNLTLFRAYDSNFGKWISRDPIAERGGINLYQYVVNNPINLIDPLGLDWKDWLAGILPGGWLKKKGTDKLDKQQKDDAEDPLPADPGDTDEGAAKACERNRQHVRNAVEAGNDMAEEAAKDIYRDQLKRNLKNASADPNNPSGYVPADGNGFIAGVISWFKRRF